MSEESLLTESLPAKFEQDKHTYKVLFYDGMAVSNQGVIQTATEILDPYKLDLSQFVPNTPIRLEEFVTLTRDLIEDAQNREQTIAKRRVHLVQEYEPEMFAEQGDEVITYKIIKRAPANMSRDGKSRPNRLPNFSYEYRNPLEPTKVLYVESRPIDHIIELTPWAKTSTLANSRALWLERLLISQRWAYTSRGVKPFHWLGRGTDTLWTQNGARFHQRPMQFSARLHEYTIAAFSTIKEFEINFNLEF